MMQTGLSDGLPKQLDKNNRYVLDLFNFLQKLI